MTSEIESSKLTVILCCMKMTQIKRGKLQWRLLAFSNIAVVRGKSERSNVTSLINEIFCEVS